MNFTHTIVKYPSVDSEQLYDKDGLLIAGRVRDILVLGGCADPSLDKHETMRFIDAQSAAKYLRTKIACGHAAGQVISIDEREGESRIVSVPAGGISKLKTH